MGYSTMKKLEAQRFLYRYLQVEEAERGEVNWILILVHAGTCIDLWWTEGNSYINFINNLKSVIWHFECSLIISVQTVLALAPWLYEEFLL